MDNEMSKDQTELETFCLAAMVFGICYCGSLMNIHYIHTVVVFEIYFITYSYLVYDS